MINMLRFSCLISLFLVLLACKDVAADEQRCDHKVAFNSAEDKYPEARKFIYSVYASQINEDKKAREELNLPELPISIGLFGFDLNEDGAEDFLAYISGTSYFCGSHGCKLEVFLGQKEGYSKLDQSWVAYDDLCLSKNTTNGFHDLLLLSAPATNGKQYRTWSWNGKRYECKNCN
jgi:hypothetical protein